MAKKLTSSKAKEILHDKSVHGHPLTDKQRRFFGAIAGGAKPYENGGWLDKYEQGGLVLKQKNHDNFGKKPNVNDDKASFPEGFVGWEYNIKGRNYSPAWGGQFKDGGNIMPAMAGANQTVSMAQLGDAIKPIPMQLAMGGSLPGAVGFTYARTAGAAPANGPYAKKTKASAQDGDNITKGKDFLTKMAKSPLFGERYATMTGRPLEQIDPKEVEDYRSGVLKNIETVKAAPLGEGPEPDFFESNILTAGIYVPNKHTIYQNKIFDVPGVLTHELSHATTRGQGDLPFKASPFKYAPSSDPNSLYGESFKNYLTTPTEIKARRDAVAELMMKKGMWDPTTEKFTEKHYDQLKALEKNLQEKFDKNLPYDYDELERISQFKDISDPYDKDETIRIFNSFVKGNRKMSPIAQNGQEMKYYQEGLDFKPKTISQDGSEIPVDPMGYWNPENWGSPVTIPSTDITMEGVDQPLIGVSDTGDTQMMYPGEDYEFDGEYVTEYPVAKKGVSIKQANLNPNQKLDQLLNFTNYNKPTKGGWLDKYN